jgi:hypothetical protein
MGSPFGSYTFDPFSPPPSDPPRPRLKSVALHTEVPMHHGRNPMSSPIPRFLPDAVALQLNRPTAPAVPSLEQFAHLPPGQLQTFSDDALKAIIREAQPGCGCEWLEVVARDELIEQVIGLLWRWESGQRYTRFREALLNTPEESLYGTLIPNDWDSVANTAYQPSAPVPQHRNRPEIKKVRPTGRGGRPQCTFCRTAKRGWEVLHSTTPFVSCFDSLTVYNGRVGCL